MNIRVPWYSAPVRTLGCGRKAFRQIPDLATLVRIAESLGTSPNWLLGVAPSSTIDPQLSAYIERFANAANGMTKPEIEMCVIQAEAVVAAKSRG
jgi:hypothetical protein